MRTQRQIDRQKDREKGRERERVRKRHIRETETKRRLNTAEPQINMQYTLAH
jgi:hypothetical protein